MVLLAIELAWFVTKAGKTMPERAVDTTVAALGNTQQIGNVLFQNYLLPFELASILLLVAMVGAVVMAKKRI